jgi:hypothetical protein
MSGSMAEGIAASIRYKFSASGAMTSNALAVATVDPGASAGQVLRRVSSDLDLSKGSFTSAEVRSDRQVFDMRHTARRVQGSISGELSPGTYQDFFQALTRGTWGTANTTLLPATYTSVSADSATSSFAFTAADPVTTGGIRVGSVIRFTGLSPVTNNNINYLVTAVGGTSNRTITVFPAPTTHVASVTFTCTLVGRRLFVPNSGHVSRKLLVEEYYEDIDLSRIFNECRVTGTQIQLQPDQAATVSFPLMGRDMSVLTGAAAPFFATPTAETTTSVVASVGGLIVAGGQVLGVMTGLNFSVDLSADAPSVNGQNFTPNVFLGKFALTGSLTAFFENATLLNYFLNETEFSILGYFTSGSAANADAVSFYMPRVKASGAQLPLQGDTGQVITMPFTALRAVAAAGIEPTTLQIVDTAAV